MKKYDQLLRSLQEQIVSGVLPPGARLPSVRGLSAARGVSRTTVLQAYQRLESRGLVQARPRSGYYVSDQVPEAASRPASLAGIPAVSDRVLQVLRATTRQDVVPLSSAFASPALYPVAPLARAMSAAAANMGCAALYDNVGPGDPQLRTAIALRYAAAGMAVQADELIVTAGGLEALNLCLAAVTRPGDAVVVESPGFYGALQALERLGLRAVQVPVDPVTGLDLPALARALQQEQPAACWLMTSFQNPTGVSLPDAGKQALVDLLARRRVPLIEDDVYGELYFGARRPRPAAAYDREGLVLHCGSFSKSLAPALRIGWARPGRFLADVLRHKLTTTLATSPVAQAALARYLHGRGYEQHLRRLRRALSAQRDALLAEVAAAFPAGTTWTRPQGGYFLWVTLPGGVDARRLYDQALALGIGVAPGTLFSMDGRYPHCLRLNYGHAVDARMRAALRTLGELARRMAAVVPPTGRRTVS